MVSHTTDGNRFSDGVSSAVVRRAIIAPAAIIAPSALISIIIIRQTTREPFAKGRYGWSGCV